MIRRRLLQWSRLRSGDRWRLSSLMLALPLVRAMLRVFGFVRTRRWLERISATPAPGQVSPDELLAAQRLAWLVGIAGRRGPIRTTCLPQALLIYYQLRRRTLAPQLILGVRMRDGAFDAHAWTELQTVPLGQFGLEHSAFERRE